MYPEYLPMGLNALISAAIIVVCICRLDKVDHRVLLRVGCQYILLLMAAAGNGLSPLMYDMPGWPTVFFSLSVLFMLIADSYQWRRGPPESATCPAPLGER